MAQLISGFADAGGSQVRKATSAQRAHEDLQSKLKGRTVTALTSFTDDTGLHLLAACEDAAAGKSKKGGK